MEHGSCKVIYFDPRASSERNVLQNQLANYTLANSNSTGSLNNLGNEEIDCNLRQLSAKFGEVQLCTSSKSCITRLREHCKATAQLPTVLLIYDGEFSDGSTGTTSPSGASPTRGQASTPVNIDNLEGIPLLQYIQLDGLVAHVAPILLLPSGGFELLGTSKSKRTYPEYFAFGAADVVQTPLTPDRASGLPAHGFRVSQRWSSGASANEQPTKRRASWVGVDESKPYAYLRESMVSGLMDRICDPAYIEKGIDPAELKLSVDRKSAVARAVGLWSFSAHDYSDDELLYGAFLILKHVLKMPGLEKWRLKDDEFIIFLIACRRVYNSFVIYHNFRHACDVLQAAFCFMLNIGVIPPFSSTLHDHQLDQDAEEFQPHNKLGGTALQNGKPNVSEPDSAYSSLLRPFEAMTLVISCIGHDVGHPGVNNLFLVTLNAPLAQLYNDRSVLESFHCAAFSQILRRYWPTVFSDVAIRKLMINSILATDMSHHNHYVDNFENMRLDFTERNFDTTQLSDKTVDNYRELICCLLIKCADICNVARKYSVATEWADILTNEFANQAQMETELEMPSCLFGGPPVLNDMIKMGTSQIGFMNFFAIPLFRGMSLAFPGMQFTVDELTTNKATWERIIEEEKGKAARDNASATSKERAQSPHTRRGSAYAQSQMRADPMVFGSHSSSSVNQTRRQSATVTPETISSAARRASLGPTVIPINKSKPNSRRTSAGVIRAEELPQQAQGASGIASAMGFDGQEEDGLRSTSNGPRSSGTNESTSIQQLISNPPEFVSKDPSSLRPSQSETSDSQTQEHRPATASPSSERGREQNMDGNSTSGARDSNQSGQRPRSRSGRKFLLKFWRKTKSTDNLARDAR